MDDGHRLQEAIRCLAQYGYDVIPDGHGYVVSSRTDPDDRSFARHLADLDELAELFAWREQRLVPQVRPTLRRAHLRHQAIGPPQRAAPECVYSFVL